MDHQIDVCRPQQNMIDMSTSMSSSTCSSQIHDISPGKLSMLPSRELEHSRIRVMDMEKSLKWWTDCSTNWREKWTKAHSQRNKAREECKLLYGKIEKLKNENENKSKPVEVKNEIKSEISDDLIIQEPIIDNKENTEKLEELQISELPPSDAPELNLDTIKKQLEDTLKRNQILENSNKDCNERIEFLTDNIQNLHLIHTEEMKKISLEIGVESEERIEQKTAIQKLREQIEKLQADNTAEWNRADRCDTESRQHKSTCKKLAAQLERVTNDLENARVSKEQRGSMNDLADAEIYRLHQELNDHRIQTSRLTKQLQDSQANADHLKTRSDSYDLDTRNLRSRVQKLKNDLANQQDLFEQQVTSIKKCKRDKDELEQLNDCLQIECDQLRSRLRMRSKSKSPFRSMSKDSRSSSLQSFEANEVSMIEDLNV